MYPLTVRDNFFYVGERCLGSILEVKVTRILILTHQYIAELENRHEILIQVDSNTDLDRFLFIAMNCKIWIWCFENKIIAEISNYDGLEQYRRSSGS